MKKKQDELTLGLFQNLFVERNEGSCGCCQFKARLRVKARFVTS